MRGPSIHSCDELPSSIHDTLELDQHCLEYIKTMYDTDVSSYKGKGFHGSVYALIDKDTTNSTVAVKILPFDTAEQQIKGKMELRIACQMNGLSNETSVFMRTFGWLVCDDLPGIWNVIRAEVYLLVFVEKFNYTFDTTEFTFSDDDMYAFLFLMLHGLYVARNEYGFFHNDIKLKNLMLSIVGTPTGDNVREQQVYIDDVEYTVSLHRGLIPKFIDFGESQTFKTQANDYTPFQRDIDVLLRVFEHMSTIDIPELLRELQHYDVYGHDIGEQQNFARFLRRSKVFNNVRSIVREPEFDSEDSTTEEEEEDSVEIPHQPFAKRAKWKTVETCVLCPLDAKFRWKGNNEGYCSKLCANKVKNMVLVL